VAPTSRGPLHEQPTSCSRITGTVMRDVNVDRLDANGVTALRSCIFKMINKTQKCGSPPNSEDVFDAVCGFYSGQACSH
jgi:hypothetical protein